MTRIRAAAVDDVIRASALIALGVPERTVYRRCLPGGPWQLLAAGVVLLSNGVPTRRQRLLGALAHGGKDAQLTGLDGARLHGLRRGELPEAVHILIPAEHRAQSTQFITVERTKRLLPVRIRDGLRVAPMERCLLDRVRRMRSPTEIAALLTEPVQRSMLPMAALREELDAGCRKGSAVPRAVLGAVTGGVRSPAEFDVRAWWLTQASLPGNVLFNVRVTHHSTFLGVADALVPDIGLVAPIDSVEHHFMTPEQVRDTERQHRAYRSAGLHVVSIRPSRVHTDRDGLLRDVLDAVRVARELPYADIEWGPDLPGSGVAAG